VVPCGGSSRGHRRHVDLVARREAVATARAREEMPLAERIPGTAIFVTRSNKAVPHALLHVLKHFKSLHQRAVVLMVRTEDVPHVSADKRLTVRELGNGFIAAGPQHMLSPWRKQLFILVVLSNGHHVGREAL
jgi:K+ transporter